MLTRYDLLPVRVDQAIRQAAILGAFPPGWRFVRSRRHSGNTGRYSLRTAPVYEDLQRHGRSLGDLPYLVQR